MWYLTLHRWIDPDRPRDPSALDQHLDWMQEHQLAGEVLMAGPTPDHTLGIIVFGHLSEHAVHELCRSEPFVAAGHRSYEVIPWDVHHAFGIGTFARKPGKHGPPAP